MLLLQLHRHGHQRPLGDQFRNHLARLLRICRTKAAKKLNSKTMTELAQIGDPLGRTFQDSVTHTSRKVMIGSKGATDGNLRVMTLLVEIVGVLVFIGSLFLFAVSDGHWFSHRFERFRNYARLLWGLIAAISILPLVDYFLGAPAIDAAIDTDSIAVLPASVNPVFEASALQPSLAMLASIDARPRLPTRQYPPRGPRQNSILFQPILSGAWVKESLGTSPTSIAEPVQTVRPSPTPNLKEELSVSERIENVGVSTTISNVGPLVVGERPTNFNLVRD